MTTARDIQKEYVKLLKSYLDPLGKEAVENHIVSGERYSTLPYISDVLLAYYESFPRDINDFWKTYKGDLERQS